MRDKSNGGGKDNNHQRHYTFEEKLDALRGMAPSVRALFLERKSREEQALKDQGILKYQTPEQKEKAQRSQEIKDEFWERGQQRRQKKAEVESIGEVLPFLPAEPE